MIVAPGAGEEISRARKTQVSSRPVQLPSATELYGPDAFGDND